MRSQWGYRAQSPENEGNDGGEGLTDGIGTALRTAIVKKMTNNLTFRNDEIFCLTFFRKRV